MYYLCSANKGADQLRSYCSADQRLFFAYVKIRFSHDAAHMSLVERKPGADCLKLTKSLDLFC